MARPFVFGTSREAFRSQLRTSPHLASLWQKGPGGTLNCTRSMPLEIGSRQEIFAAAAQNPGRAPVRVAQTVAYAKALARFYRYGLGAAWRNMKTARALRRQYVLSPWVDRAGDAGAISLPRFRVLARAMAQAIYMDKMEGDKVRKIQRSEKTDTEKAKTDTEKAKTDTEKTKTEATVTTAPESFSTENSETAKGTEATEAEVATASDATEVAKTPSESTPSESTPSESTLSGESVVLSGESVLFSLARRDFQLLRRAPPDAAKLPLFALVATLLGELTPLICYAVPEIMPSTCCLPSLLPRVWRAAPLENVRTLVRAQPPDAYAQKTAFALPPAHVRALCSALRLKARYIPSWMYPEKVLRQRLQDHYNYLCVDDFYLSGHNGDGNVWSLTPQEVVLACLERNLGGDVRQLVSGTEPERRERLAQWRLKLVQYLANAPAANVGYLGVAALMEAPRAEISRW
ncbi:hypothetical protein EJF18_30336 [Clavispora lusitaniae]|uniref:Uncharacterized protein n=1 Tax=Clavispora lusitaniae TaxID=36911 RepID=A0ACD0WJX7_CLALS|nr:hypothetical protein EJF14_30336 [Clavispora lusitaniae]QFZ33325.1 hypothetical protein EJF16_30336 [Clavispora lusitaniae]QFZ38996.1 hypothetical protein EJF15_30336 [Clavispora lusitaniae]QFZ44678.1 hypothetical protein EJF18_30336 [Clavispora lusitaniae]QFZ50355.1 hypothetical protein EJF17_30336 [Clavispora lusitaniae]